MGTRTETLDEAFEMSAVWYLEKSEIEELTDEEWRSVDFFYALQKSLSDIPPALMQQANELAAKYPLEFQRSLESLLGSVNDKFRPATAAEFVEQLIRHIRRETEALALN
jgi:hypothetical protein